MGHECDGRAAHRLRRAPFVDRPGWGRGGTLASCRGSVVALLIVLHWLGGCTASEPRDAASREAPSLAASPNGVLRPAGDVLPASVSRDAALGVSRDIMRAARYCALVTHDATGESVARTIDPAPPDSAMVVRFVTNPRSRKVAQLAADARVTLYYFDAAGQRYATVYGRARLVVDSAERRARWHEGWTPFYPERERGATLYEVIPERLEVVSPGDGVIGDSLTWATPTLRFATPAARP
jgi:general stress protein 26